MSVLLVMCYVIHKLSPGLDIEVINVLYSELLLIYIIIVPCNAVISVLDNLVVRFRHVLVSLTRLFSSLCFCIIHELSTFLDVLIIYCKYFLFSV